MSAKVVRSMPCWCRSWTAAATRRSRLPGRASTAAVFCDGESDISLDTIPAGPGSAAQFTGPRLPGWNCCDGSASLYNSGRIMKAEGSANNHEEIDSGMHWKDEMARAGRAVHGDRAGRECLAVRGPGYAG